MILSAVVLALGVVSGSAQDPTISAAAGDKYVISAKAGGVNYVQGTVAIVRKSGVNGRLLKGDTVQIGDRISTGADGLVEVLLNPGSYLRLAGNSAFEFKNTELENLELRVDRGSAILEVYAAKDFLVTVNAPRARFRLINSGVFRLDVASDGSGTLAVWKGRALVGTTGAGLIRAGTMMKVSDGLVKAAKFDRDSRDEFDNWSRERGRLLAKMTSSLQRRELRSYLLNTYSGNQWNVFNSFGLWVYNGFTGTYCFLPFGSGWYSPYGFGFGRSLNSFDLPWYVYTQHYPFPTQGGNTPNNPPAAPVPTTGSIMTVGDRTPTPPFIRMQQNSGGSFGSDRGAGPDYTPNYAPRDTSPPSPPPVRFEPMPDAPRESKKDGH